KFSTANGRLKNYDELVKIISSWTKERSTEEIIKLMDEKNIPCGKVNTIEDLLEDDQLRSRNMLLEIAFQDSKIVTPGIPVKLSNEDYNVKKAPDLGENT